MLEGKFKLLDPYEFAEALTLEAQQRCWDEKMQHWFLVHKVIVSTTAKTKEEFYGFHASDIVRTHWWKAGYGGSVFFRLRDGRVIDAAGRSHDPDIVLYDQTIH